MRETDDVNGEVVMEEMVRDGSYQNNGHEHSDYCSMNSRSHVFIIAVESIKRNERTGAED